MASNLSNYAGREQSYIKHQFLTHYLRAAAYKILQGRSPIFNFVDAFAGPWQVSDENFSDASFDQALRTLEAVRVHLATMGAASHRIRFCLCEKRPDAVGRLRQYAQQRADFEIHVYPGSFEDNLTAIADACAEGFTFTFIDPTGWNIRSEPVLDFLRSRRGEFLLNFMAEHVNRHAGYAQVSESFGRFLADPNWTSEFNSLAPDWGNEERVLHLLKKKIKETGAALYLPDFPILKPREQRVKMRLILGTNSEKGLEVFRDTQDKVEREEIETRNHLRSEGNPQDNLFPDDLIAAMQQKSAGIGCPAFQREAELRVMKLLRPTGFLRFDAISTSILEFVPIRMKQLRDLLNVMRRRDMIEFDLPPRKKLPQPDTQIRLARSQTRGPGAS
ncbi:three-Cys-motif partner protein TcmP [soil metagenome]